ncbi:MAG: NAD(P)H-binding protein [Candidatus Marinimicrobia bacterium]|jgi:NADH dehydrogenase|nr:NAD(P)H-binding protein [Candidatus Neomarinimicrobiota bacterium]MDP6261459.1 NAD(P)H-binding protein [Candidatus Neomarinimicrobiota bacterium]MDP7127615.1 NAD(P)H-binding protein [Candidatus Neomarinimicrobiota bacterium]MDP7336720.1 NAD(P)H-binding protein [Candidatus Neomarinimicrobiota bacterium]MDP7474406.1 NAD(P)H-binding protein [Candidatus Neomarinimicrobiota bacterium]|tara:strand:+ start:1224 stop:2144 length:921 start_codon:yes stop_codon:yes gene_type:complete
MKVALFGGTGFVGNYIVDELLNASHEPHVLVRPQNASKLLQTKKCTVYSGDIESEAVITEMIDNVDAVIYNIGLIREFPKQGITFEKLHYEGIRRTVKLAESAQVKRYILMSANGVKMTGTPYQTTKYLAEELLKNSTLDWTIFRPFLIFGDPRGTIEFCTQLKKDMLSLPFPAPLFFNGLNPMNAGSFAFSPVHVSDVAKCFVNALENKTTIGKTYEVGGTRTVSWKGLIKTITLAYGKNKWSIPAPVMPIKLLAMFFGRFSWFPVTADQLTMLMEGNTSSSKVLEEFEIEPIQFDKDSLHYLNK